MSDGGVELRGAAWLVTASKAQTHPASAPVS